MSDKPERVPQSRIAEENARGRRRGREVSSAIESIQTLFKNRFGGRCPLDYFIVMPQMSVNYFAYVSFKRDADIAECEKSGLKEEMLDFICQKLEEFDLGKRGEVTVKLDLDSRENIDRNFEGNYVMRFL